MYPRMVLLLLVTMAAVLGWHPPQHNAALDEAVFPLSNNSDAGTAIVIKGKHLLVRDFPETELYNYVMLKLMDDKPSAITKKNKNTKGQAYDVKFDLWDVPPGTYNIEFYTASHKYAAYVSYNHSQLIGIEIGDTTMDFILPVSLEKNKKIYEASPEDAETLARYRDPTPTIPSDDPMIIELANTVTAGLSTDYEKIKAVHDWVCDNIWYDYDELRSGIPNEKSVMETITSRKGVCVDYASLTAAMLRAVNIPVKLEAGYVLNPSAGEKWTPELLTGDACNHVWNEAFVNGRWVILDTTYDSGNAYRNQTFSTGTGCRNYKYFDITIEFLSTDRCIAQDENDPVAYR